MSTLTHVSGGVFHDNIILENMAGLQHGNVSTYHDVQQHNDTSTDTDTTLGNVGVDTNVTSGEPPFQFWDNPDSIMTLEQYKLTDTIVHCLLNPILFCVGVPTNLISCLVFYKQGLRDRMNLCLFVLALVDTAYLVSSAIVGFYSFILLWDEPLGREYYAKILVYFAFVVMALRVVSGCITMVVSVERCVCVIFPLRANSIMRTRTMGTLLAAIVIVLLLGFSICCFRNKVVGVYDEASGETHYLILITDFFIKHHLFYDIFYDIILSFVIPLVTFVVVGVATFITVVQLRMAIAWRATTSSGRGDNHSQQHQAALTKMLVILSCVFVACSAPLTALSIVRLMVADYSAFGRYSNFYFASHAVAIHIVLINSSINFFVYYCRSSRFKHDLLAMIGRSKGKELKTAEYSDTKSTTVSE